MSALIYNRKVDVSEHRIRIGCVTQEPAEPRTVVHGTPSPLGNGGMVTRAKHSQILSRDSKSAYDAR
jgi:hypothetical protein